MKANKKVQLGIIILLLIAILATINMINRQNNTNKITRDIYVGDIISLEIQKENISREQIVEAFSDLEIVNINETNESYIIEVRSFETGEQSVWLNNTEIRIMVVSLLDTTTRDAIYQGETILVEPRAYFPWSILLVALFGTWVVFFAYIIFTLNKPKDKEELKPIKHSHKWIHRLDENDPEYFVKLTQILKDYIKEKLDINFDSYSTKEIEDYVEENNIEELQLKPMIHWLIKCDYYKFTDQKIEEDSKQVLKHRLEEIIDMIEEKIDEKAKVEVKE